MRNEQSETQRVKRDLVATDAMLRSIRRATCGGVFLVVVALQMAAAAVHHNAGSVSLEGYGAKEESAYERAIEGKRARGGDVTSLGDPPAEKTDSEEKAEEQLKAKEKAKKEEKPGPKVVSKLIPSVNRTDPTEMLVQAKKGLAKANKHLSATKEKREQVYKRNNETLPPQDSVMAEEERFLGGANQKHSEEVEDQLQVDIKKQNAGIDKMEAAAKTTERSLEDRRQARNEETDWRPKWQGHHLASLYRANDGDKLGKQAAGRIEVNKKPVVVDVEDKKLDLEMKRLQARMVSAQYKHKEVMSKANKLRADVLIGGEINELEKKHQQKKSKRPHHQKQHAFLHGAALTQRDREIIAQSNHKVQNAELIQQYIKRLRGALAQASIKPKSKRYRAMVKGLAAKVHSKLHGLTTGYEKKYKKKQRLLASEVRKKTHEKAERKTKRELKRVRAESKASTNALEMAQAKLAKVAGSITGTRASAIIARMMALPTTAAEKRIKSQASKKESRLSQKKNAAGSAAELAHKAMFLPRAVVKSSSPFIAKQPMNVTDAEARNATKQMPLLQPLKHMPRTKADPKSQQAIDTKRRADKLVADVQKEALKVMEAVHALKHGNERQQKKDLYCGKFWGDLYMLQAQIDHMKCHNGGGRDDGEKLACASMSKQLVALEGKLDKC